MVSFIRNQIIDDLDEAGFHLASVGLDPVAAVHNARRRLKRARAISKLVGPAEPTKVRESVALMKKAAHQIGPIRDRHVSQILMAESDRASLEWQERLLVVESTNMVAAVRNSIDRNWRFSRVNSEVVAEATNLTYESARASFTKAEHSGRSQDLHECRKWVKQFHFQMWVLSQSSGRSGKRNAELLSLCDILGAHHDLWTVSGKAASEQLAELNDKFQLVGGRVFAKTSKANARWVEKSLPQGRLSS